MNLLFKFERALNERRLMERMMKTRLLFFALIVPPLLLASGLAAAQPKADAESGFSFVAYGDSRPMMYLPFKEGQPELYKLFVDMFGLVLPEKVAEEVVKKDVKMVFDPKTKDLIQIDMPFDTASEHTRLTLSQGWVTEAAVEDVKLLPGVLRTMFRLEGGTWVASEIVKDVQSGRAKFVVDSGDIIWWGNQGRTVKDSPYWKRVNDTMLEKLPPPDAEMRAAGLDGRYFLSIGNHEVWDDPKIEGTLNTLPYLRKLGLTPDRLIYKFDFKDSRFIFLWSGKYDYRSPSGWEGDRPKYAEQMKQLQKWMEEAKSKGIRKVFITFHYPVFARSGFGAIPAPDNPHKVIAAYAKDMEVVVFNGHIHTTEMYDVDGVKYLMLGGGGAEQDPILPGRTSVKVPPDYPPDLYWKGEAPKEDYNYVLVDVKPGQKTKFTLKRFRPWQSAAQFETVELYK
jgi:predicted phosphohydrolase